MKKKEKRMILVLLVILLIAIIIFAVSKNKKVNKEEKKENTVTNNVVAEKYVQVLEDGTKLNKSAKLNETKEVKGFKFENIQFTEKNGQTVLLADVTNNSGKATTDYTLVDVILYDDTGKEIVTLGGIIAPLKQGEKTQFNMSSTLDYANAYDLKIVVK